MPRTPENLAKIVGAPATLTPQLNMLCVGATRWDGSISMVSAESSNVNIHAPGEAITWGSRPQDICSGTSPASATVSESPRYNPTVRTIKCATLKTSRKASLSAFLF